MDIEGVDREFEDDEHGVDKDEFGTTGPCCGVGGPELCDNTEEGGGGVLKGCVEPCTWPSPLEAWPGVAGLGWLDGVFPKVQFVAPWPTGFVATDEVLQAVGEHFDVG